MFAEMSWFEYGILTALIGMGCLTVYIGVKSAFDNH